MMRWRFPIPAKLAVGLLLNLLLIAAGLFFLLRTQFGGASSQIFAAVTDPKVQVLADRIHGMLEDTQETQWSEKLRAFDLPGEVAFGLYGSRLEAVAGSVGVLPDALAQHLHKTVVTQMRPRTGGPPPPNHRDPFSPPPRPEDRGEEPAESVRVLVGYFKTSLITTQPSAYWVAVLLPSVKSASRPRPLLLVIRSTSVTGGGLFFDPKPWIYAILGVLILSGFIWGPVALDLTRSLRRIKRATVQIAAGDFAVQVPDANRADELGELGSSVNQLGAQLDVFVSGQRRFLGDIAHELCSPIARMQASLGILEQSSTGESQQRYVGKIHGELQHMGALVNELLNFSKTSLKAGVQLRRLILADVVHAVVASEANEDAEIRVNLPSKIGVLCDPDLIVRALGNVLRNALRYAGGIIEIEARESPDGKVFLSVRDSGPGVPEESIARLFDPFFRPDAARTREGGGVGLGLAIVKSSVEACGGKVAAKNLHPRGFEVTMQLMK